MRTKKEMLRDYDIRCDGTIWLNGKQIGTKRKNGVMMVGGIAIHTLVAEKYCEKPEGAVTVRHINRDKTDNRAENLEWVKPTVVDYDRYCVDNQGKIVIDTINGKVIPVKKRKDGYVQANGVYVHRLVAHHYLPNPTNAKTVNHKDGDKSNNSVDNLEWVSYSENTKHAINTKLFNIPKGCDSHHTFFTKDDLQTIIDRYGNGDQIKDIAKDFSVAPTTVSNIVNGHKFQSENLDYSPVKKRKSNKPTNKLKKIGCDKLKNLIKNSKSLSEVSKKIGVSRATIKKFIDTQCLLAE